jgi:cell division protease FtsH
VPLLGAGRSPHILYRPSEIDVRFEDVRGAGLVVDEVVKTLNLFLGHRKFTEHMGGSPRRALLFEGPPGTGKTYMAKAMAAEAGVPFLFVSSSAFQSMYYGQTNRKIRSYFKALRKYARREGGAIGFIEEIDAIGGARGGMGTGKAEGVSGVVNELLIQLQSFDQPAVSTRIGAAFSDMVNAWMPSGRQLQKKPATAANILVIGATNRAADLDPPWSDRDDSTAPSTSTCPPVRGAARSSTTTWRRRLTSPSSTSRRSATPWLRDLRLLARDDRAPPGRSAHLGPAPSG